MKIKDTWNQVPYNKSYSVVFGRSKNNTAAMGSWYLPIACAGDGSAYTTGFYPTPWGLLYMTSLRFARLNVWPLCG